MFFKTVHFQVVIVWLSDISFFFFCISAACYAKSNIIWDCSLSLVSWWTCRGFQLQGLSGYGEINTFVSRGGICTALCVKVWNQNWICTSQEGVGGGEIIILMSTVRYTLDTAIMHCLISRLSYDIWDIKIFTNITDVAENIHNLISRYCSQSNIRGRIQQKFIFCYNNSNRILWLATLSITMGMSNAVKIGGYQI